MYRLNKEEQSAIFNLLEIMRQLRDKETGCPWDIKQTFDSLISCTIEEVYEVKEAIEHKNMPELKEELGDLLFQIVFYAQLAKEAGDFDFIDICNSVADKLIRRHPHVFGDNALSKNQLEEADTIKTRWELIKQQERESKNLSSVMDDIPKSLPALLRSHKIQKRCKTVGFDWSDLNDVFAKVEEELIEVKESLNNKFASQSTEEELGDLLFSVVNLTRHLGFNPEMTLDKANQKFIRRFRQVEEIILKVHNDFSHVSLDEMERAWQTTKLQEQKK